jgi:DNA helicase HerA-like ATPase
MNYLAIIALCLGLILVIITLQFLNKYDELNKTLSKSYITKQSVFPEELVKIQNKLNMTDSQLKNKLINKENKISDILKEPFSQIEKFLLNRTSYENFSNNQISYLTLKQRQYSSQIPTNSSTIIQSIESEPLQKIYSYDDDKKIAQYSIEKQS